MKSKPRNNGNISDRQNKGMSPKRSGESKLSSPRSTERPQKRVRLNGGASTFSQSSDLKSPRDKQKGKFVNGGVGEFESITPAAEDPIGMGTGLNKSARKIVEIKDCKTEPEVLDSLKIPTNGVHTQKNPNTNDSLLEADISNSFFQHDRLLPGAKRTSLAKDYASSKPYVQDCSH